MLSMPAGLDDSPNKNSFMETSKETVLDVEPQKSTHVAATDREVNYRINARESYILKQNQAKERLMRYSAKHLKGDMFGIAKVQRAVINIQRVMRGKLARRQYMELRQSRFALIELFLYLLFITFHFLFATARKNNVDAFYLSHMMEDAIVREEFTMEQSSIRKTFLDVATTEEMWQFLEGPLRSNVFPETCRDPEHTGDPCLGAMHTYDYIVGVVRLRQFRAKKEKTCTIPKIMQSISHIAESPCYSNWNMKNSFTDPYGLAHSEINQSRSEWTTTRNTTFNNIQTGGKHGNINQCFTHTNKMSSNWWALAGSITGGWVYDDSRHTRMMPFGKSKWDEYPSKASYNCDFHPEVDPLNKFNALKEFNWIDQQTRAVLVELSVYNKQTNLFSSMRLFFEFPRTGGIVPYYEPYTGRIHSALNADDVVYEYIYLSLILFMTLGFMLQEVSELKELKCRYFSSLWNVLDWLNYIFLVLAAYLYASASMDASAMLDTTEMSSQGGEFVDIFQLVYKYRSMDYLFSVNLIFVFLKLLKYVRLSPKLSLVTETLQTTCTGAIGFFVIFFILMVAYAIAFWYTYGHLIYEFRTLLASILTCMYGLMAGEYRVFLTDTYYHNRTLGPMLSLSFIVLMNLIAFSIIIAMVEDAYEIAKARGKTKKGLDPLMIQMILHARQLRNFLEKLPCCPCIRKKYTQGATKKRGIKRDTTVLDLIQGTSLVAHMSWWDLLYHEIINPYSHKKRLHERIHVKQNTDVIEQEDNLHKARMLLIEKTVLEILMRMSNTKDDENEVITLEDVTQVHFANLQKEKDLKQHTLADAKKSLLQKHGEPKYHSMVQRSLSAIYVLNGVDESDEISKPPRPAKIQPTGTSHFKTSSYVVEEEKKN